MLANQLLWFLWMLHPKPLMNIYENIWTLRNRGKWKLLLDSSSPNGQSMNDRTSGKPI